MPGDGLPTDGAKEVTEAALPDAPAEIGTHDRKELREDSAKNDSNKSNPKRGDRPIARQDSRNNVEKVTQRNNLQEPADGTEPKAAIHAQKPGIKLNRRIAYETQAAHRARVTTGSDEIPPPRKEGGQDDSAGEKFRKGTASRKVTRQDESDDETSTTPGERPSLAANATGEEPRLPPDWEGALEEGRNHRRLAPVSAHKKRHPH